MSVQLDDLQTGKLEVLDMESGSSCKHPPMVMMLMRATGVRQVQNALLIHHLKHVNKSSSTSATVQYRKIIRTLYMHFCVPLDCPSQTAIKRRSIFRHISNNTELLAFVTLPCYYCDVLPSSLAY